MTTQVASKKQPASTSHKANVAPGTRFARETATQEVTAVRDATGPNLPSILEERLAGEDFMVTDELNDRIKACRGVLQSNAEALTPAQREELYQLLGECNLRLSKFAWERREEQARLEEILRLMNDMKAHTR